MKKKVLSILGVLLISISTLTGCAKCIDKKRGKREGHSCK